MKLESSAVEKLRELISEENNPELMLRVFVQGGGCSGMSYGFTFDETQNPDDTVVEQNCSSGTQSVQLLIDPMSFQYLNQAEIDYVQNIQGEQFVIRNPNAKTTCGCGSSFSINEEEDDA